MESVLDSIAMEKEFKHRLDGEFYGALLFDVVGNRVLYPVLYGPCCKIINLIVSMDTKPVKGLLAKSSTIDFLLDSLTSVYDMCQ